MTPAARRLAERDPEARAFLERHLDGRFTPVDVFATTEQVVLSQPGWTFRREPDPPGGSCVTEPGFDQTSVTPRGRGLAIGFRARTESPVRVDVLRRATATRLVRARVVARFVRSDGFAWRGPRRRAAGVYVVRLRTLTPGGRLATELFPFARRRGRFRALAPFVADEGCALLRSFSLSSPVFGGRSRRPLRVAVRTIEPARATLAIRRGARTIRRLRLGEVRPGGVRRVRITSRGLAPGSYTLVARGEGARRRRGPRAARRQGPEIAVGTLLRFLSAFRSSSVSCAS